MVEEDLFLKLIKDIDSIIRSISKGYDNIGTRGLESVEAFIKAKNSFKEGSGCKFISWYFWYIRKELILSWQRERVARGGEKKVPESEPLSYSQIEDDYADKGLKSLSSYDRQFDYEYLEKLLVDLNEKELCVVIMRSQGFKFTEISNFWECTDQNIQNYYNKGIKKARNRALEIERRL